MGREKPRDRDGPGPQGDLGEKEEDRPRKSSCQYLLTGLAISGVVVLNIDHI